MNYYKFILLALVTLILSSCGPSSDINNKIYVKNSPITREEIFALSLAPIGRIYIGDKNYAPFNLNYLNTWHNKFVKNLFHLGITNEWSPEFDCNRFTMAKISIAQIIYAIDSFHDKAAPQGVAVGEVWYFINGDYKKGHAINIILIRADDGKISSLFVDIYSGKLMTLNEKEIKSITLVKF